MHLDGFFMLRKTFKFVITLRVILLSHHIASKLKWERSVEKHRKVKIAKSKWTSKRTSTVVPNLLSRRSNPNLFCCSVALKLKTISKTRASTQFKFN
ncbi:MAG: hypothetical protein CMM01_00255 [Rhodopirellula sp.]|nr:hypothetical protein [Rhodopirellula sp.]